MVPMRPPWVHEGRQCSKGEVIRAWTGDLYFRLIRGNRGEGSLGEISGMQSCGRYFLQNLFRAHLSTWSLGVKPSRIGGK